MTYKFNGFDWVELADCWGITVQEKPMNVTGLDHEPKLKEMFKTKEKIEVTKFINGMKMVFTIDDDEEVLAEKIKQHIRSNLDFSKGGFKNKQIRIDLENFLKALIKESERDYNTPVYKGILAVESDETFAFWICNNLETLWT